MPTEESATGNYRYGSVVELTMDDPRPDGDLEEGDVMIKEGKVEDGIAFTVHHDGRFIDVECEVLETYHADRRMGKKEIAQFTAEQAKEDGVPA